ncbi:unnamed protein product [Effrenium voratum]|nr:unnamed protein product [Effrenium voratum]
MGAGGSNGALRRTGLVQHQGGAGGAGGAGGGEGLAAGRAGDCAALARLLAEGWQPFAAESLETTMAPARWTGPPAVGTWTASDSCSPCARQRGAAATGALRRTGRRGSGAPRCSSF